MILPQICGPGAKYKMCNVQPNQLIEESCTILPTSCVSSLARNGCNAFTTF